MKKTIAFAFSLILLCALSCKSKSDKSAADLVKQAAENPNVNVSNASFSIDAPDGWRETDTSINGLKTHFAFAPQTDGEKIKANINIMNESMQGYKIDSYIKKSISFMESSLPNVNVINQGNEKTNDGKDIYWIHTTYDLNNYKLEGEVYIIPIDGIAYAITATTQQGSFDKYKDDFDKIAKSFKLN